MSVCKLMKRLLASLLLPLLLCVGGPAFGASGDTLFIRSIGVSLLGWVEVPRSPSPESTARLFWSLGEQPIIELRAFAGFLRLARFRSQRGQDHGAVAQMFWWEAKTAT